MTITRDDVIDILTACSSVDLRKVGAADVDGWQATLRRDLSRNLAIEAVRIHYATSTDRIMPGHVNAIAVQLRRDQAEREDAAAREAREAINDRKHGLVDPQLGNLPIGGADGEMVAGAYTVNDAIARGCPTCGVAPRNPCVNRANGSERKMPCTSRMRVAE